MRMAQQYNSQLPIEQYKYRFPEPSTPRRTFYSPIPSMAIDAMYKRETHTDVVHNVSLICNDMHRKAYPNSWSQPLLRHKLSTWEAPPEVLRCVN